LECVIPVALSGSVVKFMNAAVVFSDVAELALTNVKRRIDYFGVTQTVDKLHGFYG